MALQRDAHRCPVQSSVALRTKTKVCCSAARLLGALRRVQLLRQPLLRLHHLPQLRLALRDGLLKLLPRRLHGRLRVGRLLRGCVSLLSHLQHPCLHHGSPVSMTMLEEHTQELQRLNFSFK